MPYIYIDKILNELRDELVSAMHAAVGREMRKGEVDVSKLYRAFTRAAAGQCSNPVRVSERCIEAEPVHRQENHPVKSRGPGRQPRTSRED